MAVQLESRVTSLENLMAGLIQNVSQLSRDVSQLSQEMRDFKDEMRVFKDEMHDFKDEMHDFKDEMRVFKDEMHDFKDEMRVFKDEMGAFKDRTEAYIQESIAAREQASAEAKADRIEMRKQWGELSQRLGTMAEDLVAPSIPRILRTVLGCPEDKIEFQTVRWKKHHPTKPGYMREFDVVASCGDYLLINETKSKLRSANIIEFAEQILPEAREFFPEYPTKKIIGCIASLYVEESLVQAGERRGLIVLGFGEDVMDVLNSPEFTPVAF